MAVTYALCENKKCIMKDFCLRYINRESKAKAVVDFAQICSVKNNYRWIYRDINKLQPKQKPKAKPKKRGRPAKSKKNK